MRKLTQKLVLSVVTMALVVIALGTSTFAWFTLQNAAEIDPFTANVTAGEGIEVSLGTWESGAATITGTTAPNWYTVVPTLAVTNMITSMYGSPLTLKDVTSANGKDFNYINEFGNLVPASATSGRFIQIKLFFRSASEKTIKLSQVQIGGSSKEWTVDVPFFRAANNATYSETEELSSGNKMQVAAWTAARVSFISETANDDTLASAFTYQRKANYAEEEAYDSSIQYNSTAMPSDSYATGAEFGASAYYKAKTGSTIIATTANIQNATALDNTGNLTAAQELVTLARVGSTGYYYGNVLVRVWIEGWDADLFDAIFTTTLSVSMKFTA